MKRAAIVFAAALLASLGAASAFGQRIDPRRPTTLVVGSSPGAAPMMRVDARRSGFVRGALPTGTLKVAWSKPTGLTIDQPALAGELLAVVSSRGDVSFFDETGEERSSVRLGVSSVGPAALTSDGTIVFVTGTGEVTGVRRSSQRARFSTRIGGERNFRAAPLPLDDGGIVVATKTDLVMLDSEGNVRARTNVAEEPAYPLVAWADKVIAVGINGTVLGWAPGREPVRLGSFGAPVDGGVVLVGDALVGVIEGNDLAEVDLVHGGRNTRSIASQGIYLGPPAMRAGNASLLALTPTREQIVTIDPAGQETFRAPLATFTPPVLPDGGVPALVAPPHVPPLVDGRGVIAYATTEGNLGVVGPDGAVDKMGEALCAKGTRSGVVGLTPFGKAGFAVVCESGTVAFIVGS